MWSKEVQLEQVRLETSMACFKIISALFREKHYKNSEDKFWKFSDILFSLSRMILDHHSMGGKTIPEIAYSFSLRKNFLGPSKSNPFSSGISITG